MRKFYACSVGQPGKDYDSKNLERIIRQKAFILHQDTRQKGVYENIEAGDILLLKYRNHFVAYGETTGTVSTENEEWNLTAPVIEWFFKDENNPAIGESTYGIQWSTLEGAGQMGTVKEIDEGFGIDKLNRIDNTTELFKKIVSEIFLRNQMKYINSTIELLNYKKQIILQGPPGTGKTRLAEIMAKELTKPVFVYSPMEKIETFFRDYNPTDENVLERKQTTSTLLNQFFQKFPASELKSLTPEQYAIGTGSNDSFCWWIERGLKPLGYYFPGSAKSYRIYWSKESEEYIKIGTDFKKLSDEDAMRKIASILSDFILQKDFVAASRYFGDSFLLKLLNTYYPDEFAPINSPVYIDNCLKLIGIDGSGLNLMQKNQKVQDFFLQKKKEFQSEASNLEFMRFLVNNLDIAGTVVLDNRQLVATGEHKLLQFHPAYSYEDFVRGITAKATEKGQIEYNVENKTLAEFAEKAQQNPSKNYLLIIDEINRANLPAVLGELIYAMEYRDKPVVSLYELNGDREIVLPGNLYIIGTMNTSDRSVAHIDYAIRRRFAFVDVLPSKDPVSDIALPYFKKVSELFIKNFDDIDWLNPKPERSDCLAPDFRPQDVWLGHSYFIVLEKNMEGQSLKPDEQQQILNLKLRYEVLPLLEEYVKDGILLETENVQSVLNELSQIK